MATSTGYAAPRVASRLLACLLVLTGGDRVAAAQDQWVENTKQSCIPAWTPVTDSKSDLTFNAVATGPDGFIYLGGSEGMHRIEGGRMRSWYPDPSLPRALPAGNVAALASQGSGLWVGTNAGLAWFDPASGSFESVPFTSDGASARVRTLYVDGDRLLIGSTQGGAYLDLTDRSRFGKLEFQGSEGRVDVRRFMEFQGRLVAATSSGLQVAVEPQRFERLELISGANGPISATALALADPDVLWLGSTDGVIRVTSLSPLASERYTSDSTAGLPGGVIEAIAVDATGTVWIGGWGGLARWRPGASAAETCRRSGAYEPDVNIPISMLTTNVDGLLIMGTRGGGVRIAPLDTGIGRFVTGEPAYGDLPESLIYSTLIDAAGRLVLGSSSGLFRQREVGGHSFEALGGEALAARRMQALYQHTDGALWIGTNRGLFRWQDGELEQQRVLVDASGATGGEFVFAIKRFGERLLVGTRTGLVVLDAETGQPERLFNAGSSERTVNGAPVTATLSSNMVWHLDIVAEDVYATDRDDVHRIDVDSGAVLASTAEARPQGRMRSGRRNGAVGTPGGEVFIATDNGIIRTDREFSSATYVTSLNGFRMGSVLNVRRSPDGMVWFTSLQGLIGIDPETDSWRKITVEDGLHGRGMTQGAVFIADDGAIAAGSGDGASFIPPGLAKQAVSPLRLTALDADGKRLVSNDRALTIGPQGRSLAIEFAAPDFVEDGRYAIKYTFSSSRQTTSERLDFREALALQQLGPGNYRLEAAMIDITGDRSPPLTLELTVLPYWWETRLAYALGLLLGLLLIAGGFYWRARATQGRADLINDERQRIAQDLHDTFLQDVFGARMVQRSLARAITEPGLKEQADRVLELLAAAAGAARTSVETLSGLSELQTLSEAVRTLDPASRMEEPLPITVEEEGDPWYVRPKRCVFLIRIVQEAVNNACKHSRATQIRVRLRWTRSRVQIAVEDNGQGFDVQAAEAGGGFGLGAMRRMAKAGRVRLAIASEPGEGTRVDIEAARFRL